MDNINLQRIEGYTVQLVAEDVWAIDEFGADIIYLVKVKKCSCDRYRFRFWKSEKGDRNPDRFAICCIKYTWTSGSCGRQSRVRKGISE